MKNGPWKLAFDDLGRLTSKTNKKAGDGTTTVNSYAYTLNDAEQPEAGTFILAMPPRRFENGAATIHSGIPRQHTLTSWERARTRMTLADGRYWDYTYDAAGQLTDAALKDPANAWLATHGYDYDAMGNPTRHKESGQVRTYTFNNLNQFDTASRSIAIDVHGLASPHQADPTVTVQGEEDASPVAATVDAEGNFVRKDVPLADGENAITVNVTDKYGRTTSGVNTIDVTPATGTPTFTYDDNGNTTGDGTFTYTWNDENRLVAVVWETEAANISLAYLYDGLGRRRRATKTVQPKAGGSPAVDERLFVYDGNNLVAELLPNHSITRKYVWGLDLSGTLRGAAGVGGLLAVSNTAATYYPTYDANGNITAYLDASDNAVYTAEYSPFGKITATTGTAPAQFGFSTIYRDEETGFLAYRFRDYDPNLGRWLSRDPIGEACGYNLYAMVGNDPIQYIDRFGLEWDWNDVNPLSRTFFLYDEVVTGAQTGIGLPFSVLSGDILSGLQDVNSIGKHKGCDFLVTINGIWNSKRQAKQIRRDAFFNSYGRKYTSSDYNAFYVNNTTGSYDTDSWFADLTTGLADFAQIIGHELGGIDNAAINTARAINKAQETGEKNCCDEIKIRVIAHSQGTMIFKRSLGYVNESAMGNIHYQGFGGQAFIPDDRFPARNVWNPDDPVPYANLYTTRSADVIMGGRWRRGTGSGHGWSNYSGSIIRNF